MKLVQNISTMKAITQNAPPKIYQQVSNKAKSSVGKRKLSFQEQFKTNEAKRENQVLLNKMLLIMNRHPVTGQPIEQ